jgi:predicted dehydrogenase
MTDAKTRVAIIGAGIGREHLAGYLDLPAQFQVEVLCDLDHARAREVVQQHSIAIETEIDAVLQDDCIDLIDICLPPHLHYDAVMTALAAGKHVICEKPLVTSLREVDEIIEASSTSGKRVFPVFQYRYGNAMAQLRALMDAGIAGKPFVASLETHWNRGADYYAIPWRGTWRGEQGGAVLGHAIHSHDLLACVFGAIEKVFASTATRVNEIETEDCASVMLQMKNGAVATSSITLGAATDTSRLRFCFDGLTAESGTLPYAPMADAWRFTAREPVQQAEVDAVVQQTPVELSGFSGFLESVSRGLAGDADSAAGEAPVTLQQARHSIELVNAIYQSAESDRCITLPLDHTDVYYNGWLPAR